MVVSSLESDVALCRAHISLLLPQHVQEVHCSLSVLSSFCCAAGAGCGGGPDAAVRQQGPENTMQQEAGGALAYAQLAVLVNERRGPR